MRRKRVYFCINSSRILFKALERESDGDIILNNYPPKMFREDRPGPFRQLKQQHISLHPSNETTTDNSKIKHEALYENSAEMDRARHWTNAMKRRSGFAPVFGMIMGGPLNESTRPVPDKVDNNLVHVCNFNPMQGSLFFVVYMSHTDVQFDKSVLIPTLPFAEYAFRLFRLAVIAIVLPVPTTTICTPMNFSTLDPDKTSDLTEKARRQEQLEGWTSTACVNAFVRWSMEMAVKQSEDCMREFRHLPPTDLLQANTLIGSRFVDAEIRPTLEELKQRDHDAG